MITTIELKQGITQEKYNSVVEMLKKIGVLVKEEKDDTKMSKEEFLAKIDKARIGKTIKMSREEMRNFLLSKAL